MEATVIDWARLEHAYGTAEDVPELLRAMASRHADEREEALEELHSSLCHQGDVYSASAHAVPELARLALHGPGHRPELLWLLAAIADGAGRPDETAAAERAVATAVPSLLELARDPDPRTREAMVTLVAACGPRYALPVLPLLRARLAEEPEPRVRGVLVTALGLLDPSGSAREARARALLADPEPRVRLAAAEDLLRTAPLPLPGDLVEHAVTARLAAPHHHEPALWPRPYRPYGERLLEDPEAALRALALGLPIGYDIVDRWRDREPDVLPWALAATGPDERELLRLARLACALPPGGRARVRDHVRPHTASGDPAVRAAAVTALARAGAPEAVSKTVRLVVEAPEEAGTAYAVEAVTEVFGAAAEPVARAVAARLDPGTGPSPGIPLAPLARFPALAAPSASRLAELVGHGGHGYDVVTLLGAIGPRAGARAERALRQAAEADDEGLAGHAAVAHHRVTGDAAFAVSVLRPLLTGGLRGWAVPRAGELGPAGAPLLPFVEECLAHGAPPTRAEAAYAVWRITGRRTEDVLAPLARQAVTSEAFHPVQRTAVRALTDLGLLPRHLVAPLRRAADSVRRVASDGGPDRGRPHEDYLVREEVRRLLATAEVVG
ncbi:HEAT repeat domain-containing protein [Streptomyces pharetrae]|uniref:HEAT repeat domain-containing protein n=1 Tax=Streptomyces pharetrae TaxID=291370 RepID=UPI003668821E